jgi:SagB-type dehydrogenase family enzyme
LRFESSYDLTRNSTSGLIDMTSAPTSFEQFMQRPDWPLSRLYHQNTKLTPRRAEIFGQQMPLYGESVGPAQSFESQGKRYPGRPRIKLPKPSRRIKTARLGQVLGDRRTHRAPYSDRAVTLQDITDLIGPGFGVSGQIAPVEIDPMEADGSLAQTDSQMSQTRDARAWPSAGALYPLELYLIVQKAKGLDAGIYHYEVPVHSLAQVASCPDSDAINQLIFAQGIVENSPIIMVLTGVMARCQSKYGERGYRFMHIEVGHAAQNLLLLAEALNLGAVPLGGFCEDELAKRLEVDPQKESPLYTIAMGPKK